MCFSFIIYLVILIILKCFYALRIGLVKKTRRIGRAQLYMLNKENPLVKKLTEIDFVVSKMMVKKDLRKHQVKAGA